MIPTVAATRYVTPLREGGSLPGLVEAEDLGIYVCKFRGAGQGVRVLVAEVIVGALAQRLGIASPDLVAIQLPDELARYEADEEVQDLLRASVGLNLGVDFLPGSFGFDSSTQIPTEAAAKILWLDAFTANVDRSWRNPNLLVWHGQVWAIDHGACLYFHHGWPAGIGSPERFAAQAYDVGDHVLRANLDGVPAVAEALESAVTPALLEDVLAQVPDEWLALVSPGEHPDRVRGAYEEFLLARLASSDSWLPGVRAA